MNQNNQNQYKKENQNEEEQIEKMYDYLSNTIKTVEYIPYSIYDTSYKIITSQDFKQKTNMIISVSLESYRVMVSSLLLLFVPQNCNGNMCSIVENMTNKDNTYYVGLIVNYLTLASFIILYFTEIRREEKLIKLLEVNNTISTDNESVGKRLELFSERKMKILFSIDKQYQYVSYFVLCMYLLNAFYSWFIIYNHSLGNQTIFNFVTNLLFMLTKLSNVIIIVNTDKNVFLSAYLNTKVQFNDIDPREMKKIQRFHKKEAMTRNIAESGGRNLLEESHIELLEDGGFIITDEDSIQ